jgi:hypothetical protein
VQPRATLEAVAWSAEVEAPPAAAQIRATPEPVAWGALVEALTVPPPAVAVTVRATEVAVE